MKKILKPAVNAEGQLHTGLLPTFVGALCLLLVKFGIVSAQTLDGETVGAIVMVLGVGALFVRNYVKPKVKGNQDAPI
jgi:hypothetical protein